jgi:hypothetical protein
MQMSEPPQAWIQLSPDEEGLGDSGDRVRAHRLRALITTTALPSAPEGVPTFRTKAKR